MLNVNDEEEKEDASDEEDEPTSNATGSRPMTKPRSKAKKRKGGKKKGKPKFKPAAKESNLDGVPLESYRIIDDEDGIVTEYLMSLYSFVHQWIELRDYIQKVWRQVSYQSLNSAVAAEVSSLAIAMVKKAQNQIWIDFPNHENYYTIMNTITRGDIEKAQSNYGLVLHRIGPDGKTSEKVQQVNVDLKEQFSIHTYQTLLAFVKDFQNTRTGKPTKSMLAEIKNWDPNFNLQQANNEQRLKWRRAYTINWLYDLVNVFASIVTQRISMQGQKIVLEKVDWSPNGPWDDHRRLYGLNEFAGEITWLAMQTPGTDIQQKILPHTVFQLQCIVDSLATSRGWTLHPLRGHVLYPPARRFRPRRDVDLFMDRENKRPNHGYCHGVDILKQLYNKDAALHRNPARHEASAGLLTIFRQDFINWLGASKYQSGLTNVPPSRFTNTNSNGLWEYSPALCGFGLMEALDLSFTMGLTLMDRIPEPLCLIHLHNLLVQKGYIIQPVGFYATMAELYPEAFFADGKAPTSNFQEAFRAHCSRPRARGQNARRSMSNYTNFSRILNQMENDNFKTKSLLRIFREAGWDADRVSEADIPIMSILWMLRIGQIKLITDPATGEKVLPDTELVRRSKAKLPEKALLQITGIWEKQAKQQDEPIPEELMKTLMKDMAGYKTGPAYKGPGGMRDLTGSQLLDFLKLDFVSDICGSRPLSSLNYVWAKNLFFLAFTGIERRLEEVQNPMWKMAYQTSSMAGEKRLSLTTMILSEQDEECLEIIADVLTDPRAGFMQFIYWEDLHDDYSSGGLDPDSEDPIGDDPRNGSLCTVM
ncbi:hypothetical protein BT63DRAFT_430638 [Microthyrium microscopicum]|uniref:DUF6604 domain-containing protein n=1 Tax=Microthyrium microscopicum TaxID=703497 RepID=A0A6A6TTX3_9PEZI|nr:hypothetical protein BT63DRAFT_430638 [Microthyrium microscopicum]